MIRRRLTRDRNAATTLEFAIIGSMLCLTMLVIVETGLLWWLKTELQVASALTARCGAIGYTFATSSCLDSTTTKSYAVNTVASWVFDGAVAPENVVISSTATACNGVSGKFFTVSMTSTAFATLPMPLVNETLSASACYPMP